MNFTVPDCEMLRGIADVDAVTVPMPADVPSRNEPGIAGSSVSAGDAVGGREIAISVDADGQMRRDVFMNVFRQQRFYWQRAGCDYQNHPYANCQGCPHSFPRLGITFDYLSYLWDINKGNAAMHRAFSII
jgi:hypothetical protein